MTHEPECIGYDGGHLCVCDILRAAYQRGREAAAAAVEKLHDDWKWPLPIEDAARRVIIDLAAAAARGEGKKK